MFLIILGGPGEFVGPRVHDWTTIESSMPAMMRSLSSFFGVTWMWRRTERANLEKKPSMRLSQEPCLGAVCWLRAGFPRDMCRIVVEN